VVLANAADRLCDVVSWSQQMPQLLQLTVSSAAAATAGYVAAANVQGEVLW
jgi:hypothetical protein